MREDLLVNFDIGAAAFALNDLFLIGFISVLVFALSDILNEAFFSLGKAVVFDFRIL